MFIPIFCNPFIFTPSNMVPKAVREDALRIKSNCCIHASITLLLPAGLIQTACVRTVSFNLSYYKVLLSYLPPRFDRDSRGNVKLIVVNNSLLRS